MRLIDANALCDGRVCNDPIVIAAKCAPTIDAVEVVRCRDCKLYKHLDSAVPNELFCKVYGGVQTEPDDYCSYGQRKDDAT